jgi:preprotein translocase subunit SecF
MQLIRPGTTYDFIGLRHKAGVVSGLLVLASLILFFAKGPNWGIDFTGGTEVQLAFQEPIDIGEIRDSLTSLGLSGDSVQQINDPEDHEFIVRLRDTTFGTDVHRTAVLGALGGAYGADWVLTDRLDAQVDAELTIEHGAPPRSVTEIQEILADLDGVGVNSHPDENTFSVTLPPLAVQVEKTLKGALTGRSVQISGVSSVGPKVGGNLRRQGFVAMLATLALVLLYIGFRFDLTFAPGAIVALFHDVTITVGIFVLIQHEVNLSMIGALLTIIGYSLNDTIVIYDRIRENMERYRRTDMGKLINDSVNETLARTLATSLTTLVAISAFLFMGGPVIETFALAMMIGVVVGTYSTVFVASPMILLMEKVKPHLVKLLVPSAPDSGPDIKGAV